MNRTSRFFGSLLGRYLTTQVGRAGLVKPTPNSVLRTVLQPGDVVLVEGTMRISQMIKYLTQSTWSHAAVFVGEEGLGVNEKGEPLLFIEADLLDGVRACPIREYSTYHTRICRPYNLDAADCKKMIEFMKSQLGRQYDLKHVFDLARYLFPFPAPASWRRRMITFGSGDPTKAICSSLVAEAFQHINYPILPLKILDSSTTRGKADLRYRVDTNEASERCFHGLEEAIFLARHHTLAVPRDFDVSPFFNIVKPSLVMGFDYRDVVWQKKSN